jgi:hypothetical protein
MRLSPKTARARFSRSGQQIRLDTGRAGGGLATASLFDARLYR